MILVLTDRRLVSLFGYALREKVGCPWAKGLICPLNLQFALAFSSELAVARLEIQGNESGM